MKFKKDFVIKKDFAGPVHHLEAGFNSTNIDA